MAVLVQAFSLFGVGAISFFHSPFSPVFYSFLLRPFSYLGSASQVFNNSLRSPVLRFFSLYSSSSCIFVHLSASVLVVLYFGITHVHLACTPVSFPLRHNHLSFAYLVSSLIFSTPDLDLGMST